MVDKGRGKDPGEDVDLDFNMDFGDEQGADGGRNPAATFGAEPPSGGAGRQPPPPPQDEYNEFEMMPEPGQDFGASPHAPRDEFGDVGGETEMATNNNNFGDAADFGHADPVDDFNAEGDVGHEHDDQDFGGSDDGDFGGEPSEEIEEDEDSVLRADDDDADVAAEAEQESSGSRKFPRILVPAVGLVGLGLVGWLGWSYVSPLFLSGSSVQTAQQQPAPRIHGNVQNSAPPKGMLPPLPSGPKAPQVAQPAPAPQPRVQPLPPNQVPVPRGGVVQETPQVAAGLPDSQPIAVRPQPQAQPQVQPPVPTAMNRPGDDVLAKIYGRIDGMANDVKAMSRRLDDVEKAGVDMRADLGRRIDEVDARAKAAPPTAPVVAAKPSAARPANSEKSESVKEAAPRRAGKRVRHAKVERRRAAVRDDAGEDRAYAGDEPPPKPRVIGGYRLKGVSEVGGRSIALVKTSKGLEEVAVGQTLAGGGEVRSIRQNGGSWVVVTSRGVIVE